MARSISRVHPGGVAVLWCCALAACSHTSGVQPAPQNISTHSIERGQQTRMEVHSERLQGLMSEHFGFTARARDATSIGDVVAAREALLHLANYAYDDVVPGAWLVRVRGLQGEARVIASTTSLDALAGGLAQLGRACGECHTATGGGPALSPPPPEAESGTPDSFPDRMFRHRAAIEQLWAGLVAPSDAVWDQAAALLARPSSKLDIEGELPSEFDAAFDKLQYLGERARLAKTPFDRAQSYGQILGTCANCHRKPWTATF